MRVSVLTVRAERGADGWAERGADVWAERIKDKFGRHCLMSDDELRGI